jgi:SAM-dependent methyltransferase
VEFDSASEIFDLYIDWKRRLAREMPFLIERLNRAQCTRVADVACGKGVHALALAEAGFEVTAIDPNRDLLGEAAALAASKDRSIRFEAAAFHALPGALEGAFEAAVCLGNSLSLVEPESLQGAMAGLAGLLKPEGVLILHTLNYAMLSERGKDPWGPVRVLDNGSLIIKGFLPRIPAPWDAVLIHLERDENQGWRMKPVRFQLHPHTVSEIEEAGAHAGLALQALTGGFGDESPEDSKSADLVYEFVYEFVRA